MGQISSSNNFFDRVSFKRNDKLWITEQLKKETTKFIPVFDSKNYFLSSNGSSPLFLNSNDITEEMLNHEKVILLGQKDNGTFFALGIDSQEYAYLICSKHNAELIDLKVQTPLLEYKDYALLANAKFMIYWNSTHRYCGKCGKPTRIIESGNSRVCSNENCKQQFFPSMDPAVIVLVSSGEKCLLGRQPIWQKGRYSTIAGFVEPGETLEDAVIREVKEETGINVNEIKYTASQPWLFPSSLMLGFTANAINTEIKISDCELEDARWFSRKDIRNNIKNGSMSLPTKVSIAYNLIKDWYEKGNIEKLN